MIEQYIDNFLINAAAEKGSAQLTIAAYKADILQFWEFSKIKSPEEITEKKIELFLQHLQTEDYAPKSLARKLSALKEFCKFLHSEKI